MEMAKAVGWNPIESGGRESKTKAKPTNTGTLGDQAGAADAEEVRSGSAAGIPESLPVRV